MIKNQFNSDIVYALVFISSFCVSISLSGALGPKEMFQDECEELVAGLKSYERQLFASIFHRDTAKINDILGARTSSSTQVTSDINDNLCNILIAMYPELDSKQERVWKQQEAKQHPALNIVATLLTHHSYLSMNFCNQNSSELISNIAYQRLLSLCPTTNTPNTPSPASRTRKILDIVHNMEKIIKYDQLNSLNTYFMIQYEQPDLGDPRASCDRASVPDTVCSSNGCIPFAFIRNNQSSTCENANIAPEDKQQSDDDKKKEKNNSTSAGKTLTQAPRASQSSLISQVNPRIARLFLSERSPIFREFKHLPS